MSMKSKKCKSCNGMGFTMTGIEYKAMGYYLQAINKKEICLKCYGKGRK